MISLVHTNFQSDLDSHQSSEEKFNSVPFLELIQDENNAGVLQCQLILLPAIQEAPIANSCIPSSYERTILILVEARTIYIELRKLKIHNCLIMIYFNGHLYQDWRYLWGISCRYTRPHAPWVVGGDFLLQDLSLRHQTHLSNCRFLQANDGGKVTSLEPTWSREPTRIILSL